MYKVFAEIEKVEREKQGKFERAVKANCPTCKVEGVEFNYKGYNAGIFPQRLIEIRGMDSLVAQYGDALVLYVCSKCEGSSSLATLKAN